MPYLLEMEIRLLAIRILHPLDSRTPSTAICFSRYAIYNREQAIIESMRLKLCFALVHFCSHLRHYCEWRHRGAVPFQWLHHLQLCHHWNHLSNSNALVLGTRRMVEAERILGLCRQRSGAHVRGNLCIGW